jgi:hypothetical protein
MLGEIRNAALEQKRERGEKTGGNVPRHSIRVPLRGFLW